MLRKLRKLQQSIQRRPPFQQLRWWRPTFQWTIVLNRIGWRNHPCNKTKTISKKFRNAIDRNLKVKEQKTKGKRNFNKKITRRRKNRKRKRNFIGISEKRIKIKRNWGEGRGF